MATPKSALRIALRFRSACICLLLAAAIYPKTAVATLMRIGPFDFDARANFSINYSTNVEQERKSEATLQRNDFFFLYGFGLATDAQLNPNTTLSLSSDLRWEKYLERTDLDETAEPFGETAVNYRSSRAPWSIDLFASHRRQLESRDDAFVPGQRKKRDDNTIVEYGGSLQYDYRQVSLAAGYSASLERHEEDIFKDADEDIERLFFDAGYRFSPRFLVFYRFDRERSDLLLRDDDFTGNEDTHAIGFTVDLWLDPRITYGLRYEKEAVEEDKGEWEFVHSLSIRDERQLSPTVRLDLFASYEYEEDPERDDVSFTYGASLTQDIDPLTTHSIRLTREPVDTFGSTADTTSTETRYLFSRRRFLLPDVTMDFDIGYTIDEPKDPSIEKEETLNWRIAFRHTRSIRRNLNREIAYVYTYEDSSLEREILDEHLFTLGFTLLL